MESLPSTPGRETARSATIVDRTHEGADANSSQVLIQTCEPPRRALKTPDRLLDRSLTDSTATPSERVCDLRSTSPRSEDAASVRSNRSAPIQPTPFEPRWDLNATAPQWNRVVEMSATRAMGLGCSVQNRHESARTDLVPRSRQRASSKQSARSSRSPRSHQSPRDTSTHLSEIVPGKFKVGRSSHCTRRRSSTPAVSCVDTPLSSGARSLRVAHRDIENGSQTSRTPAVHVQRQVSAPSRQPQPSTPSRPFDLFRSEAPQASRTDKAQATPSRCSSVTSSTRSGGGATGRDNHSAKGSSASGADVDDQVLHGTPEPGRASLEALLATAGPPPKLKAWRRSPRMRRQNSAPAVSLGLDGTKEAHSSKVSIASSDTQDDEVLLHSVPSPREASSSRLDQQRSSFQPPGKRHEGWKQPALSSALAPRQASGGCQHGRQSRESSGSARSLSEADQLRRFGAGSESRQEWDLDQSGPQERRSVPRSPLEAWASQVPKSNSDVCPWQLSAREVRAQMLRSTTLNDRGVYDRAEQDQTWKVSQLKIKNLPDMADERPLSRICQAFGQQVVSLETAWDPVKDRPSGGKASLVLRSTGAHNSTAELVNFLEGQVGCKVR